MADFKWPNGRRAAISLSYDDALPVHREETAPQLEAHGLRATFYVPIDSDLLDHRDAWARVAAAGHELGNHTIFHPCRNPGNRNSWPLPHRNLCDYTPARWEDEVRVANRVLRLFDGRERRSFGHTCCDVVMGQEGATSPLDPIVAKHFVVGRGKTRNQIIDPATANLADVGCCEGDGTTIERLRTQIDRTLEQGGWTLFMFHGVGRDHRLMIDVHTHAALLALLAERRDTVWTAPVVDIGAHVAQTRG